MNSSSHYLIPFSNIEIIILANQHSFSQTAFNGQLLPFITIGNKTILQHTIDKFSTYNYFRLNIVCLEDDFSSFEAWQQLESQKNDDQVNSRIQIFPVSSNIKTCDIIRQIVQIGKSSQDNLPGYFVVYPLNLFTSINIEDVIDFHRANKSQMTLLVSNTEQGIQAKERRISPGFNMSNYQFEGLKGKRFIVYDESKKDQLVQLLSNDDALKEDCDLNLQHNEFQNMELSSHVLKKYPTLVIDTSLIFTGACILSPEIIEFLLNHPEMNSIESELIPSVCLENHKLKMNSSIYLFRIKTNDDFAFRLNDFVSYYVANMRIASGILTSYSPKNEQQIEAQPTKHKRVSNPQKKFPDGFVFSPNNAYGKYLSSATLNPQIHYSIIGENCTIGKNVKIMCTIIHDHAVIEDGVDLRNCIICSKATIRANSQISWCIVMPDFTSENSIKCTNCIVKNQQ